ncbi:hypothetical protein RJ639_008169 [Escallonia herrerae]|uniref:Uncharacterized protein n=1 Tax=Escallonia herrerae TaxID=1293975 RepID=A0AA89AWK9_9ASTE|nr:hypothetical protein RJ639_008169 [Escallonia herrerae]
MERERRGRWITSFWHLEQYFEAFDIDDEEENVQMMIMYLDIATLWWRHRYTDRCNVKTEPHDLASIMEIVERLEDFKQGERPRSLRHKRTKDGGDSRSKSGSPKVTDDEQRRDKGRCRHHKRENKHEGSCEWGDSRDHKAHAGPIKGCFYCAGLHYRRYSPHKGKMIAFLDYVPQEAQRQQGGFFQQRQGGTHGGIVDGQCVRATDEEVVKNINLRIDGWTRKAHFNIIDMDELGVVLGMDFVEKLSATLNPYCRVMMMAGKDCQPEWMIPLVSKGGVDARKG